MPLHASESDLISGLKANNPKAQEKLYTLFSAKMFAVCKRYLKDVGEAEDLLVEGFLKVFKKIDHFKGKGSFEGWLRRIFVNLALDVLRNKKKMELQVSWSDVSELADDVCEDADVLLASEALSVEDLLGLIEDLKDPYGLVFSLYVLDNLSHQEISEQLEITLANSKSILHRARKQLQLSIINVKKNTHGKVRI